MSEPKTNQTIDLPAVLALPAGPEFDAWVELKVFKAFDDEFSARAFSQDTPEGWWAMRELMAEMEKRKLSYRFNGGGEVPPRFANQRHCGYFEGSRSYGACAAETLPHAVARAAIAACWNEKGGA